MGALFSGMRGVWWFGWVRGRGRGHGRVNVVDSVRVRASGGWVGAHKQSCARMLIAGQQTPHATQVAKGAYRSSERDKAIQNLIKISASDDFRSKVGQAPACLLLPPHFTWEPWPRASQSRVFCCGTTPSWSDISLPPCLLL